MSRASEIRAALKKAGYTARQVSVTGPHYPRVTVKVAGIPFDTVEEISGRPVSAARGLLEPSAKAAQSWLEGLPADGHRQPIEGAGIYAVRFKEDGNGYGREFGLWEESINEDVGGEHIVSDRRDAVACAIARRLVSQGKEFPGAEPEKPAEVPTLHGVPVKEVKGRFYLAKGPKDAYPGSSLNYANMSQARGRVEKLRAQGVPCELVGWQQTTVEILPEEPSEGLEPLPVSKPDAEAGGEGFGLRAYARGLKVHESGKDKALWEWIQAGKVGRYSREAQDAWAQGWRAAQAEDPDAPRCTDCGQPSALGLTKTEQCQGCWLKSDAERLEKARAVRATTCPVWWSRSAS